jgi:hypothetical protein
MHNYTIAMEALINEIGAEIYRKDYWENGDAERKFGPIKNSPVPFIPCQYHGILVSPGPSGKYPGGNLYPDKSWEGARLTGSGQHRRLEYYGGFNVIKDSRGRCLIPDTPNNRERLSKMSGLQKQVYETETFRDQRGVTRSRRVIKNVLAKPLYTIIAEASAGVNMEEMIRAGVERALREAKEREALPPDTVVESTPAVLEAPAGMVDLRDEDLGQPAAPAVGGGEPASPPATTPQPTKPRRASTRPPLTAAAEASGDDY